MRLKTSINLRAPDPEISQLKMTTSGLHASEQFIHLQISGASRKKSFISAACVRVCVRAYLWHNRATNVPACNGRRRGTEL